MRWPFQSLRRFYQINPTSLSLYSLDRLHKSMSLSPLAVCMSLSHSVSQSLSPSLSLPLSLTLSPSFTPFSHLLPFPTASLQATQAIQAKCPSTVTLQLPRSTLTPKPTMNLLPPRLHRQMAKGNCLLQEDVLALAVLLGAAVDRTTVALLHHLDVHLMLPLYVPYSSRGH